MAAGGPTLEDWVGRREDAADRLCPAALARLAAVLDHETSPWPADAAFPLAHWLCFLPSARQSGLDVDGHPQRGGFLPPVPLPRRMWAGGRLRFHAPLPADRPLERRSTIAAVRPKQGGSGALVFVVVRHELSAQGVAVLTEEQDLVYREAASGAASPPQPAPDPAPRGETVRSLTPDPTLLFRFSALTFNAHRIHYDRDYARAQEGYAGLVVHGPLLASLLLDHYQRSRPGRRVTAFAFRAKAPVLDVAPFDLCLQGDAPAARLWVRDHLGREAFEATVEAE